MQSPLPPAHPVPGFRPTNDGKGQFFYGGCAPFSPSRWASPRVTPFTPSPSATPRSTASPRSPTSSSSSGSLVDGGDGDADDTFATGHPPVLHYKTTPEDHYRRCVAHLADAAREAAALRMENEDLRVANSDLASHFAMLATDQGPASVLATPTPAHNHARSLSIRRSTGRGGGHGNGRIAKHIGHDLSVDQDGAKAEEHQRGGGEKRGEVLKPAGKLNLYSQGSFKTELCQNWEKTGLCHYHDRCWFAHGIAELRPVVRHPQYKTTLCRLFASGCCTYGYRCHFRHSITPADYIPLLHP